MRNIDIFILIYSTLTYSTVFSLSILGEGRIDAYVVLFIVEYFIASALTAPFSSVQKRRKTLIGIVMLIILIGILIEQIIEILQ